METEITKCGIWLIQAAKIALLWFIIYFALCIIAVLHNPSDKHTNKHS